MNYRHLYHAGNFADVCKHILVTLLLEYFKKKENGFCFIDTHAGIGLYDLAHEWAEKTKEAQAGIYLLIKEKNPPSFILPYLKIINAINKDNMQYYPGSPLLAQHLLRAQDQIILNELHEDDFKILKKNCRGENVFCHHRDAYEFLPAMLPPKLKRGLVLIDPPYEKAEEFKNIVALLKIAIKKWPQGIYAVWSPIKDQRQLYDKKLLATLNVAQILFTELKITNLYSKQMGLIGSNLAILNPPWQFEEKAKEVLHFLCTVLTENKGSYSVELITL